MHSLKELTFTDLQPGDRVRVKYEASNSAMPLKIHGLWVTIEKINQMGNPEFWCPWTNKRRTLKSINVGLIVRRNY